MKTFPVTDKTKITRLPKRGTYDEAIVHSIIDEALFVTLAYVHENTAWQIPTGHVRINDYIYVHGSVGSTYMRRLAENKMSVSISATIMDGIVLARSAFHHSVNYRSVVIFSNAELVEETDEQYRALEAFTNKMQPGRWDDVRTPDGGEWKATMVLRFRIDEASAKIRTGDPKDDEEDYKLPVWAGVVPLRLQRGTPVPDTLLRNDIQLPDYLK